MKIFTKLQLKFVDSVVYRLLSCYNERSRRKISRLQNTIKHKCTTKNWICRLSIYLKSIPQIYKGNVNRHDFLLGAIHKGCQHKIMKS